MKLCGCVSWCKIGLLIVFVNLLLLPHISFSQDLPPIPYNGVSNQHAIVGQSFSYDFSNAFTIENGGSIDYDISTTGWLGSSGTSVSGTPEDGDVGSTVTVQAYNSNNSDLYSELKFTVSVHAVGDTYAAFTMNTNRGCESNTIHFLNKSHAQGDITYHWDFGNGNDSPDENPSAIYSSPGVYTVTLTINGGESTSQQAITIYSEPENNITGTFENGCEPLAVSLSAENTGAYYYWEHSLQSGGEYSLSPSINYDSLTNGVYGVRLETTASSGCKKITFKEDLFEVYDTPIANFSYSKANTCEPSLTTFTNESTVEGGSINSSQWIIDGTNYNTNDLSVEHTFTSPGTYNASLVTTTDKGCVSDTVSSIVTFNSGNTASFNANDLYCLGDELNVTAQVNPVSGTTYQWTFDGSIEGHDDANFIYDLNSSGQHNVGLVASFNDGCVRNIDTDITVEEVNAQFDYSVDYICDTGYDVSFDDKSAINTTGKHIENTTWYWKVGGGSFNFLSESASFTHRFVTPGNYTIRMVAVSEDGCNSTAQEKIQLVQPSVEITVEGATYGCLGDPTSFTATYNSPYDTAVSYAWDFGDEQSGSGETTSHKYSTTGIFDVSVLVTTNTSCTVPGVANEAIALSEQPDITNFEALNNPTCYANATEVNAEFDFAEYIEFVTPSETYTEEVPSGNTSHGLNYFPFNVGTYSINATVYNYGCASDQASVSLEALNPKAAFTASQTTFCEGGDHEVSFTNGSSYTPGKTEFEWDFGDGSPVSTELSPNHTYTNTGDFTVYLTVTDTSNTCSHSYSQDIHIYSYTPGGSNLITADNDEGCAPLYVNSFHESLTDQLSSNYIVSEYLWDFNNDGTFDDTTSTGDVTYTYDNPGNYSVKLKVTSNSGCNYEVSQTELIRANGPVADFSYTPLSVCMGDELTFQNETTHPAGETTTTSYLWDFGDGATSNNTNPKHTYTTEGTFTVSLKANDATGCSATSEEYDISVQSVTADFEVPNIIYSNNNFTFTNNSSGDIYKYLWNFGDGSTSEDISSPQHTYSSGGEKIVSLTVEASNGCSNSYSRTIEVINATANFTAIPGDYATSSVEIGCANDKYTDFFPLTEDENVVSYSWNFGDGSVKSTLREPRHTYKLPGTYTVSLEIEFYGGYIKKKTKTNYIIAAGAYGELSYDNTPKCSPNNVLFEISNMSSVQSIWLDCGNGTVIDTTDANGISSYDTTYTYINPDKYGETTPALTLADSACGSFTYNNEELGSIYTSALPTANFSTNYDSICKGVPIQFSDLSISNDPRYALSEWNWDFGTSTHESSQEQNPEFAYSGIGIFRPQLIAENELGCRDTFIKQNGIQIYGNALLNSFFTIGDTLACPLQLIDFTSEATTSPQSPITTYEWNFGDGYFTTGETAKHGFDETYKGRSVSITHIVTDDKFCTDSTTYTVEIDNLQAAIAYAPQPVYRGSPVVFNDASTVTSGTTVETWNWNFENATPGSSSSEKPQDVIFNNIILNNYTSLEVTNNIGCTDNTTITFDILNNPPIVYSFTITIIENSGISFSATYFDNDSRPINDYFDHQDPDFGQSLVKIRIESLPDRGILYFNSSEAYTGLEIPSSEISNLSYTPDPDWNGNTSFQWNGFDGIDWATSSATVEIVVLEEPDPPILSDIVFNVYEDSVVTISRNDFLNNINTSNSFNLQSEFDSLRISAIDNPSAGLLYFNGIAVTAPMLIRGYEIDNENAVFTFVPTQAFNGSVSFSWNAFDGYKSALASANVIINYSNTPPDLDDIVRINLPQGQSQTIDKSEFLSHYYDEDEFDIPVTFYLNNLPSTDDGSFRYQGIPITGEDFFIPFEGLTSIDFTPRQYFEGTIEATWMISDGDDTGTALIRFEYVNDPPIVHSFSLNASEDVAYEFSTFDFETIPSVFPFEDIDPTDKVEAIQITTFPLHGSLLLDGSAISEGDIIARDDINLLTYLTNFDWNGIDTVHYNASDGTDWAANDSLIFIYAAPVNDAPRPEPDFYTIDEDQLLTGKNVGDNDFDVDDNHSVLTYSVEASDSATAGEFGSIQLQNNGDLTFTPNQDVNGTLFFVYTVCDDEPACAKDTVWITINPLNDRPTANADVFDIFEDEIDPIRNCLTNDGDIDGNPIRLLVVENSFETTLETIFGTLTWDIDGNLTLSLNEELDSLEGGESTNQHFEYIIGDLLNETDTAIFTINIIGLNDPPTTADIDYYTKEGTILIQSGANYATFLSNDFDPEGDPFTAHEVNGSSSNTINEYGTFNWQSDGNWEFYQNTTLTNTLKQGETLDVEYSYTAIDNFSKISNPALITFHIAGVNDAPIARNDTLVIYEDQLIVFVSTNDAAALLNNDSDVDGDSFDVTLVNNNTSGNVNGTVGLLHWSSDGAFSYESRQDSVNQLGAFDKSEDIFTYYIADSLGATATAQLVIIINGLNDAPIANDDEISIYENTYITVIDAENGLLSNDGDADNDPIIVAVNNLGTHVLQGEYGILTWESNGAFTYVTDSTLVDTLYFGEEVVDVFTYRVTDPLEETDRADLYITIIGENDAPVAENHFESITEDDLMLTVGTREKGIIAEDSDIDDNDNFGITLVNNQSDTLINGTFGKLDWNYDGTFIYTLNPDIDSLYDQETVIDSFLYVIEDPYDSTDWAYFIIEITGLNDNPEAQFDTITISEDTLVYLAAISLLENDSDTDGDFIKQNSFNDEISSPIYTTFASFNWDSNGYFTYERYVFNNLLLGLDTLAFDDVVYDSIPYSISDSYNFESTSYLSLIIQGENDPPVAWRDINFISENTPSITSAPNKYLLYNDYEIDRRDSIMLYAVNGENDYSTDGVFGTLTWSDNGSYKYTLNFDAIDTLYYNERVYDLIPYSIIDKQGAISTDTLEITLIGANDRPIATNDTVDIMEDERSVLILVDKQGLITNDYDVDGDLIVIKTPNGEAVDSIDGTYGIIIIQSNGQAEYILNEKMDSLSAGELVEDYFDYTINDGRANAFGKIIIRITGENDLPLALDDFVSIDEDTDSIIAPVNNENALLFNDTDVDGDTITVISINDSTVVIAEGNYGELQWDSTGAYVYVIDKLRANKLAEGDTVNEQFTYIISDTFEGKDTALLTIEIIGVNDPPVALFDTYQTFDIAPIVVRTSDTIDILDNDYDVDGNSNHITLVEQSVQNNVSGNWGILNWLPDGSFTYQPDSANAVALRPDEFRTDVFDYTIEDDLAASDTSTININILGINNAPIANNDSIFIHEDDEIGTLSESALLNDKDPDLDTLRVTQIENDSDGSVDGFYGTVTWDEDGEMIFTPKRTIIDQIGPSQIKTESYTHTIIDEGDLTASADLVVRIIGENDPIVAYDDYVTLNEDTSILVDVLANDIDPDNNFEGNLAKTPVTVLVQPSNGTASVNSANGFIFYVPNENFAGLDSLLYRVCDDENSCSTAWVHFDVTPINDPPLARYLLLKTPINTPVGFNALDQVVDVDDGINPASLILPSYHLQTNGDSIIYTPPVDSVGRVEFIYSLADYANQRAYVVVTIIIQDEGFGAQNDTITTHENTAIDVKILENDTLNGFVPEPLSLDILIFPLNGIASYSPFEHYITYQPFDDFNGSDSLSYIVASSSSNWDFATVYINVEPINSPIIVSDDDITTIIDQSVDIPILNNDFDADNGIDSSSVIISSYPQSGTIQYDINTGLISYIPNAGFRGYDTFTYNVCDLDTLQTSCGTALVYIRVKSKFDDLEAQNDVVNTMESTPVTIEYNYLISNDIIGDGVIDPASFTIITGPQHGTYTFDEASNTILYTPEENYFGYDWMTYQVCDNDTSCDMAQINIWIQEVNTPPIANNDQYVVTNNTEKRFHVLLNDYDIDGTLNWESLDTISGMGPRKGTIEFDRNTGTILYRPSINADIDEFTYTICDDEGLCSKALVTISVDLGSTILYNQITYEDVPDTFDIAPLLANYNFFFDVLTYIEVVAPKIGTWEIINNNTQIVYVPDHDSIGDDYYNLTLYSGGEDTVDLKVTVSIIPVNDAPVAINDTVTWNDLSNEITFTFNDILKNDYDVDSDSILLTEMVIEYGDSLHVTFNADSTITVRADTVFWCDAWFTYEITDSSGAIGIGKVFIFPVLEGIIANKDTLSVDENTYIDIDVLENDLFKDNQRCTIDSVIVTIAPANGNAYTSEENTIVYTPNYHYYGPDSLMYTIIDIWGQIDSAWVVINVIQRNTPPIAVADERMNNFGSELIISVLDNDYDPDSDGHIDTLRTYLNIDEYPQNGEVWLDIDSAMFVYTPNNFTCEGDQFSYTIFDNEGDSASATVYISLPDEAPLFAITDTVKTWPSVPVEFNVLSNDGGYFLPYVEYYTYPNTGNIEQTGDSTFMFYPNVDFMGNDSMTYQLVSPCENQAMGYVIFMIEELRVPEIISPNNDGKNDVLIIDGIQYFPDALLQIFNRYGHIVYQSKAYQNNWGGYSNQGSFGGNKPLPSGTYFYTLTYNEGRNKQAGPIYIFR